MYLYRKQDVSDILQFLHLYDRIVIVVADRNSFGYITRQLIKLLGEPRKMIGGTLYYYGKEIALVSAIRKGECNKEDLMECNEEAVFYAGWESGEDEQLLFKANIGVIDEPIRSVAMWQHLGMSVDAMLRALQVDGYNVIKASYILSLCGVI